MKKEDYPMPTKATMLLMDLYRLEIITKEQVEILQAPLLHYMDLRAEIFHDY